MTAPEHAPTDLLVQVSEQLSQLTARLESLEEELGSRPSSGPAPSSNLRALGDEELDAGFGEETTAAGEEDPTATIESELRRLRELRPAVDEVLSRAERELLDLRGHAERLVERSAVARHSHAASMELVDRAHEESRRIRDEAESRAAAIRREAQEETEETLRAAREEAEGIVGSARNEADRILRHAREQADGLREEAEDERRRAEGERERVLEHLYEERDRLIAELDHLELRRRQLIQTLQGAVSNVITEAFDKARDPDIGPGRSGGGPH